MNPSGEVTIQINDKSYRMRPSFKCLAAIEEAINCGISKMVNGWAEGDVRHGHIAHIIHQGIRHGEDARSAPSLEVIGEWMQTNRKVEEVFEHVITPFIMEALKAGPKAS